MKKYQIAIDGASGVGKSTVAEALAERLNFLYVNTGLLFRAVAYYFLKNRITDIESGVEILIKDNVVKYEGRSVFLNQENVTDFLKSSTISEAASKIAQHEIIRNYVLNLEHKLAQEQNVIMEGRDIGTVILPNATLKVFLKASNHTRAKRRYKELKKLNQLKPNETLETIELSMQQRDLQDQTRKIAPLVKADDAIAIETDNLNLEAVILKIQNLFLQKLKNLSSKR